MVEAEFKGMEDIGDKPAPIQQEGLKLTRNSKGHTWEIKILEIDLDRLEKINDEMERRFGNS